MKVAVLFGAILIVVLCGCTTLYTQGPVATVETPEAFTDQPGKVAIVANTSPGEQMTLVDDAAARPLNVNSPPDLGKATLAMGGLDYSAGKKWEFGVATDFVGLGSLAPNVQLMAKKQILGDAYSEAGAHVWSSAIFCHLDAGGQSISGDQKDVFGAGGYPWSAASQFLGADAGASIGYRPGNQSLLFMGASVQAFQTSGHVNQSASKWGDYPAASADLPTRGGQSETAEAGYQFGTRDRFTLAYSYTHVSWYGLQDDISFLSIGFGAFEVH